MSSDGKKKLALLAVVYFFFSQCEPDCGLCANFLSGSRCLRPGGPNHRTRINTEIAELFLSNLSCSRSDLRLLELRDITEGTNCRLRLLCCSLWYQAITLTQTPTKSPNESCHKINPHLADLRGRACFPPTGTL